MFRTVPLSIIRSISLYTLQWYVSYRFSDSKLSANLHDMYHCCVRSEKLLMKDRGTVRNMQSFIYKNKFEKLVRLVGFIIEFIKMHGPLNVKILSKVEIISFLTYTSAYQLTCTEQRAPDNGVVQRSLPKF